MQRDAYASLVRLRHKRKTPIRIMHLSGKVVQENLVDDFFRGYRLRRLALMTHRLGQDPRLPRLPKDIIIPDYKTFLQVHQPHFMYRLLPLLSADVEAFAAMQAICASPGSPFSIEDRQDAQLLNYHISFMCTGRDRICKFFEKDTSPEELKMPVATRVLPLPGIYFQGLLVREGYSAADQGELQKGARTSEMLAVTKGVAPPLTRSSATASTQAAGHRPFVGSMESRGQAATTGSANSSENAIANDSTAAIPSSAHNRGKPVSVAAFITTHETCCESTIKQRSLMTKFFHSPLYQELVSTTPQSLSVMSVDRKLHFMAVKRLVGTQNGTTPNARVRAQILKLARQSGLYVYEKVREGEYFFAG